MFVYVVALHDTGKCVVHCHRCSDSLLFCCIEGVT